ncbi:uncharacterized protein PG986_004658 [Apiospora aurea]|uniref:BTB domain-containing protein n=1 Tax=Apiospora aurea TaxID=335848 RepID=A0ABR1QN91_9PEZI
MFGDPAYFYIDEEDAQAVWWIITWIYTGCLPGEVFAKDGSDIAACLRLIRCSWVFLLPDLTAHARSHLYHALHKLTIEAQTAFYEAEDSDGQFDVSELRGFFAGVRMVYEEEGGEDEFAGEKPYFLGVVKGAHFWPLLDSNFQWMARASPQFWADVMSLQQTAIDEGAHWPYWKPQECCKCEHSPWKFADLPRSIHWARLKLVQGKCEATCNRCAGEEEERKSWAELWEEEEEERQLPLSLDGEGEEEGSSTSNDSDDTGYLPTPSARDEEPSTDKLTSAQKRSRRGKSEGQEVAGMAVESQWNNHHPDNDAGYALEENQ